MASTAQRRSEREIVFRNAEVRADENLLVGTVLDVSQHGAFFRPEAGVIDGSFLQIDAAVSWLGSGSWVDLAMQVDLEGQRWLRTPATVRWTGENSRHQCLGVGLQFGTAVQN
jgi:hypothetical protein